MAGRPREFDRNEALMKARNVFWERGYEGTTMTDLVSALGIASARIYAAFGSKEAIFDEAIALYSAEEGGFATRALAEELDVYAVFERILQEAVTLYTRPNHPHGCMIVSSATNCTVENQPIRERLAHYRLCRAASLTKRLQEALDNGELHSGTNIAALGDYYAIVLHGLSVQAADGVGKDRLLSAVTAAMLPLWQALTVHGPTTA